MEQPQLEAQQLQSGEDEQLCDNIRRLLLNGTPLDDKRFGSFSISLVIDKKSGGVRPKRKFKPVGGGRGRSGGIPKEVEVGKPAAAADDADQDEYTEAEIEELLVKNISEVYMDVFNKVASNGYSLQEALNTLMNALGTEDAVPSKVLLEVAKHKLDVQFPATELQELGRFALEQMLELLRRKQPQLTRAEAMWCLLLSDMNVAKAMSTVRGEVVVKREVDAPNKNNAAAAAVVDVRIEDENSSSSGSNEPLTELQTKLKLYEVRWEEYQSKLNAIKAGVEGQGDTGAQQATVGGGETEALEAYHQLVEVLLKRVSEQEKQLRERTDWAKNKVLQAAQRLSKDVTELKKLRAEREEANRAEEHRAKKLLEMENSLRQITSQLDHAKHAVKKFEVENAEMRAELEAAKLNAEESVASCLEVSKREKKSQKAAQSWDRQKSRLQEELAAERRKVADMHQQLAAAKNRLEQAEVRIRQEVQGREEAVLLAEKEKLSRQQAEEEARKRENSLQRKAELECRRLRDDAHRLEAEIRELRKLGSGAPRSWEATFAALERQQQQQQRQQHKQQQQQQPKQQQQEIRSQKQSQLQGERECVMCLSEEMSVVFLPCAHQVVCTQCNELHEKQGMRDCPSCRTPIQHRLRVYGPGSS